jgi:prepilin-type N-terminal cleavage/methylation domain-containing protein
LSAASSLKARGATLIQDTRLALSRKARKAFTLIEILTVVAVMTILVAGGIAIYSWVTDNALARKDAEIMYDIQRQMRMYAASQNLKEGDTLGKTDLIGTGKPFGAEPKSPKGTAYTWGDKVPARGTAFVTSPHGTTPDTTNW